MKDVQRERQVAEKKKLLDQKKKEREGKESPRQTEEDKPKEGVLDGVRRTMKMGTMFKQRKAEMQAELLAMLNAESNSDDVE